MSGLPYDPEPRGSTVQYDYGHRVYTLDRWLTFHEWNQLEVERDDLLDRSGQRRRWISIAFPPLTRPAHHIWQSCCAPDLTRGGDLYC